MNEFVVKNGKKLKTGYTTGSCAAAATKAAAIMLLGKQEVERVQLTLPSGDKLMLEIEDTDINANEVTCSVRKDAGDDPDATHGLKIFATVRITDTDYHIDGGIGVGRVTKEGLACKPGEAAINPVPRRMIEYSLKEAAESYQYRGGFEVTIFVPGGEVVAEKTFNARLGILGGISILGTTGIVDPMSEAAIIETIKLEINTKSKEEILFVTPGNYGLEFAKSNLGLDMNLAVKCSNYIGETLDYANFCGVQKILLVGHIGKLVKLAAGVMNTHSKMADCRNEIFAAHAALCSAGVEVIQEIMQSGTTDEIHKILEKAGLCSRVYDSILDRIMFQLNYRVRNKIQFELVVFTLTDYQAGKNDEYRNLSKNNQNDPGDRECNHPIDKDNNKQANSEQAELKINRYDDKTDNICDSRTDRTCEAKIEKHIVNRNGILMMSEHALEYINRIKEMED